LLEAISGHIFLIRYERWRDAESFVFLRFAVSEAKKLGYSIVNVDSTVSLEAPKLRPYIEQMREGLAVALEVTQDRVSIKAKTGEGIDAVGERRAVRTEAIVLLEKIS
jgi:2-C-methyl-D-erythritol 2,4-cyclodiphosphate synthase